MINKSRIAGLIVLVVIFFNILNGWAYDNSVIIIRIHTSIDTAKDTPAEVLLTDPQNRRTGFDSTAPFDERLWTKAVLEIPRAIYSVEGIADNTGGGEDLPFYRELYVPTPLGGTYMIQVIGKETGGYRLSSDFYGSDNNKQEYDVLGFIVAGQTVTINVGYNPAPSAPPLVIAKTVTFDGLLADLIVAQKLKQLGEDKFITSLIKMINLAEKLASKCDKHKKSKECKPASVVLDMVSKRLETANRKCDSKDPRPCDENNAWNDFDKEHRKDHDYDDFFKEWDRDEWHKHKQTCKRFVSDEAFKIIKEDVQWLIKSLGAEIDTKHGKSDPDRNASHSGKKDKKDNR